MRDPSRSRASGAARHGEARTADEEPPTPGKAWSRAALCWPLVGTTVEIGLKAGAELRGGSWRGRERLGHVQSATNESRNKPGVGGGPVSTPNSFLGGATLRGPLKDTRPALSLSLSAFYFRPFRPRLVGLGLLWARGSLRSLGSLCPADVLEASFFGSSAGAGTARAGGETAGAGGKTNGAGGETGGSGRETDVLFWASGGSSALRQLRSSTKTFSSSCSSWSHTLLLVAGGSAGFAGARQQLACISLQASSVAVLILLSSFRPSHMQDEGGGSLHSVASRH